jgi:hypothetical protein
MVGGFEKVMTEAQNKFYWRLWSMLRKADPEADRHGTHRQLGLAESHTDWSNAEFDQWKGHCLAKAQPGNFRAQVQQLKMPEIRRRVFIDYLLAALGKTEDYAEAILSQMNRHGAQGGPLLTLETATEDALEDVMIALKKECRRHWRTKDNLLGELMLIVERNDFDPEHTQAAVMKALCWRSLPRDLAKLYYEPLLIVLSVLRRLESGGRFATAPAPAESVEVDIPF